MKSKDQKRKEALERKRRSLVEKRDKYLETQKGGKTYNTTLKFLGKEEAEKQAEAEKVRFQAACKEAGVDEHGNDLEKLPYMEEEKRYQEELTRQRKALEYMNEKAVVKYTLEEYQAHLRCMQPWPSDQDFKLRRQFVEKKKKNQELSVSWEVYMNITPGKV